MPKIGRIDVPDTLWEALVELDAKCFTKDAFDIAERELQVDLLEPRHQLWNGDPVKLMSILRDCVTALIRIQINDFDSDDRTIRQGDDYNQVRDAAAKLGYLMGYRALSADKQLKALKALVDSHWEDMDTGLPHPSCSVF